ncbi:MAG: 4Fe-4S dicluster domain-containing protein [Acidobacteria bacterium]|nr:4Fe-4S dicluster domain-containing protein [Acidobacteriota bacterium]
MLNLGPDNNLEFSLYGNALDRRMQEKDVNRILEMAPFSKIDASKFPASKSLQELLEQDARLVTFMPGDIIVRRGDYGTSAFFILRGCVRVVTSPEIEDAALGHTPTPKRTHWQAFKQLWTNHHEPEYRPPFKGSTGHLQTQTRLASDTQEVRAYLSDPKSVIERYATIPIQAGEFFGEIAALTRTPRTATIFAENVCQMIEIRWQGLRDLRRFSTEFRQEIDQIYRERSLKTHLAESSLFKHLDVHQLGQLVDATEFESYGDFDWYPEFRRTDAARHGQQIAKEPLIAQEGDYINDLLLIRAGFARQSIQINEGHRTIGYLGSGDAFGLEELIQSTQTGRAIALKHSLRAVGYVNLLRVPADLIQELVLPRLPSRFHPPKVPDLQTTSQAFDYVESPDRMDEGLLNFIVGGRHNNGTATMLIHLNRCTGCDDCVRACSRAHDGNPRFVRQGPRHQHLMVASACMHCVDPVCMLGCPTGAIHRKEITGDVDINPKTCIGCSNCANNCPYDNIRMVEVTDAHGEPHFDLDTERPRLQATKCDLCSDQVTGPACQYACPHDALKRIDMRQTQSFKNWLQP